MGGYLSYLVWKAKFIKEISEGRNIQAIYHTSLLCLEKKSYEEYAVVKRKQRYVKHENKIFLVIREQYIPYKTHIKGKDRLVLYKICESKGKKIDELNSKNKYLEEGLQNETSNEIKLAIQNEIKANQRRINDTKL